MQKLEIINPRKDWVTSELSSLVNEWEAWQQDITLIQDHPYDRNTHSSVFADGEENMNKHDILQMKTITFLDNNISGHWFINGRKGNGCDRTDLRLNIRVKHRLQDLREIQASLQYALLADSYWKQKGKEMIDKIADKSPEVALDIVAGYLKNPMNTEL
ncbi:hypothetical protein BCT47_00335 [Vibrio splendidus]|uniref:Uncharacterized protein n=1 Tax=Vibrio splendidus TaxID=29497 RepID=A0AB35MWA7_VIBSP|nr:MULTISPECIES: hypothetical protein [Vibrio]MDP2500731.1 hypothetical protein [Vibrio splendidus]PMM77916.1 hypothetical protein BCT47_00335 [Vibrio splendidus]BBM64914.1 hypothetical protein VA249_15600 [Vibrio alfacsensis]